MVPILLFLLAGSADAATLDPLAFPSSRMTPSETDSFGTLLAAHEESFRDTPGDLPSPWFEAAGLAALLAIHALLLATALPRGRAYAVRAASAMSRIRRTIARTPFER